MAAIAASPTPKVQPQLEINAEAPEVPVVSNVVKDNQPVQVDFVNYAVRSAYGSQFVEFPYDTGFIGL